MSCILLFNVSNKDVANLCNQFKCPAQNYYITVGDGFTAIDKIKLHKADALSLVYIPITLFVVAVISLYI